MVYWTIEYFKVLYKQFQASGQSVRDFCKEQGIRESRFYFWVKKLKEEVVTSLEEGDSFIPIVPHAVVALSQSSEDIQTAAPVCKATCPKQKVKLTYPNGVTIQLDSLNDLETLKQLVTLI